MIQNVGAGLVAAILSHAIRIREAKKLSRLSHSFVDGDCDFVVSFDRGVKLEAPLTSSVEGHVIFVHSTTDLEVTSANSRKPCGLLVR